MLDHKLAHLDAWTDDRRHLAARYSAALSGLPVVLPAVVHQDHVIHLYVLRTAERTGSGRISTVSASRRVSTIQSHSTGNRACRPRQPAKRDFL